MQLNYNDGLLSIVHSQAENSDIEVVFDTGESIVLPNVAAGALCLIGEITPPNTIVRIMYLHHRFRLKVENITSDRFTMTLKSGAGQVSTFVIYPGGASIATVRLKKAGT